MTVKMKYIINTANRADWVLQENSFYGNILICQNEYLLQKHNDLKKKLCWNKYLWSRREFLSWVLLTASLRFSTFWSSCDNQAECPVQTGELNLTFPHPAGCADADIDLFWGKALLICSVQTVTFVKIIKYKLAECIVFSIFPYKCINQNWGEWWLLHPSVRLLTFLIICSDFNEKVLGRFCLLALLQCSIC